MRKKGIDKALVKHCKKYCLKKNMELISINARAAAVEFYQN
ncbi:GNAT family N-acetyltransferase [Flavobacterium sp. ENC]